MAFLVKDWDGQLRPTPGFTVARQTLPVEWGDQVVEQIGVQVVGVTRVGNDDWIHVEFVSERCGDAPVKALKPVDGWLPAYQADGTPSAWFYSRGC